MALYYFDTRDNDSFIRDEDGVEVSSFAKVKLLASDAMADLARMCFPQPSRETWPLRSAITAARFLSSSSGLS